MRFQILGKKLGMTEFYHGDKVVPCTVIEASPNVVTQIKTPAKDGYSAIQVGFGKQKPQRMTKPVKGHFGKGGIAPTRHLREFRLDRGEESPFKIGDMLTVEAGLTPGDYVDVTATSKGKGFQGVMKKYNFKGFISSHGTHEFFRHGGSIGCRLTPGRVFKGKKMPGQMGNKQVTVQNLVVYKVDGDKNLIFVKGAVPGARGGMVRVAIATKRNGAKADLDA